MSGIRYRERWQLVMFSSKKISYWQKPKESLCVLEAELAIAEFLTEEKARYIAKAA